MAKRLWEKTAGHLKSRLFGRRGLRQRITPALDDGIKSSEPTWCTCARRRDARWYKIIRAKGKEEGEDGEEIIIITISRILQGFDVVERNNQQMSRECNSFRMRANQLLMILATSFFSWRASCRPATISTKYTTTTSLCIMHLLWYNNKKMGI